MAENVTKKVTRKVIKRAVTKLNPDAKAKAQSSVTEDQKAGSVRADSVKAKKTCYFCESKTMPDYTDINNLRRSLTERGKIVPKLRSGLCSKHQRRLTINVKYARHLGLIPFTSGV